jgi:hypothetical protein
MAWWRASKSQRENLPPQCFLDPANRKFIVCPERGPRKPTCDGLLAARRRTILTGTRCGLEQKAIELARKKGCAWAQESQAKCPRRGR